jgi:hypothetical protein
MTPAKGTESGDYELSLILDGLDYVEAKETCLGLADTDSRYTHTERRLKEINAEILEIEGRYEHREDAYDETESLCIQSEHWWSEYQNAAAELIRGTATVHTLCANSLEAHINIIAQKSLSGAEFYEFDKLSLHGKWLFYPFRCGQGTSPGAFATNRRPKCARPFQGNALPSPIWLPGT